MEESNTNRYAAIGCSQHPRRRCSGFLLDAGRIILGRNIEAAQGAGGRVWLVGTFAFLAIKPRVFG